MVSVMATRLPTVLEALDAAAVRGWCRSAADALRRARSDIDAMNVYPVADGDTGTNLHLTMEAVAEAAESPAAVSDQRRDSDDVAATWRVVARGALLGARGNSGVLMSQVWRGLADVLPLAAPCRGQALGQGLRHAASLAYAAVARPVEGTLLTVVRAAGEATAGRGDDLGGVARAAADGARGALAQTTGQLDTLARAGVVDAGGAGLCVILDALVATVSDRGPQRDSFTSFARLAGGRRTNRAVAPESGTRRGKEATADAGGAESTDTSGASAADICASAGEAGPAVAETGCEAPHDSAHDPGVAEHGPAYEVMYLLDADETAVGPLRERLDALGDSLLVVGGERLWNVHVHVDDAGAAIEAGIAAGRPHRIQVTYLRPEALHAATYGRGVVAVARGAGMAELFAGAQATVLHREFEAAPSVGEILGAIRRAGDEVVVLPNDPDVAAAAETAAQRGRGDGRYVSIVPTKSAVQGLAALAVHDPRRRFDDDVIAMTAAAGATRFGQVVVASGPAVTSAGICRVGDVLGMIEGDVVVIGTSVRAVAVDVVDRMLSGGGELVTFVSGQEAPPGLADGLLDHLHALRPDVETAVYTGGQPDCPLLMGVE